MKKRTGLVNEIDRIIALKRFTDEELKNELKRRQTVERAKRHVQSAKTRLDAAQTRYDSYVKALKTEDEYARKVR